MVYELDDFPLATVNSAIDVNLPVGTYTFELVVVDSAGLESVADTVTIKVIKDHVPPPTLERITPTQFTRDGLKKRLIVTGTNLLTTCKVEFLFDDQLTSSVSATIDWAAEKEEDKGLSDVEKDALRGTERILALTTEPDAPLTQPKDGNLQKYALRLTNLGGSVTLVDAFTLVELPRITDYAPKRLGLREQAKPFVIKGEYLWIDWSPLEEHHVDFLRTDGTVDERISAQIDLERSSATKLVLDVEVNTNDPAAIGARQLQLTTPAGTGKVESQLFHVTEI